MNKIKNFLARFKRKPLADAIEPVEPVKYAGFQEIQQKIDKHIEALNPDDEPVFTLARGPLNVAAGWDGIAKGAANFKADYDPVDWDRRANELRGQLMDLSREALAKRAADRASFGRVGEIDLQGQRQDLMTFDEGERAEIRITSKECANREHAELLKNGALLVKAIESKKLNEDDKKERDDEH